MPTVAGKKYPYTREGIAAAKEAAHARGEALPGEKIAYLEVGGVAPGVTGFGSFGLGVTGLGPSAPGASGAAAGTSSGRGVTSQGQGPPPGIPTGLATTTSSAVSQGSLGQSTAGSAGGATGIGAGSSGIGSGIAGAVAPGQAAANAAQTTPPSYYNYNPFDRSNLADLAKTNFDIANIVNNWSADRLAQHYYDRTDINPQTDAKHAVYVTDTQGNLVLSTDGKPILAPVSTAQQAQQAYAKQNIPINEQRSEFIKSSISQEPQSTLSQLSEGIMSVIPKSLQNIPLSKLTPPSMLTLPSWLLSFYRDAAKAQTPQNILATKSFLADPAVQAQQALMRQIPSPRRPSTEEDPTGQRFAMHPGEQLATETTLEEPLGLSPEDQKIWDWYQRYVSVVPPIDLYGYEGATPLSTAALQPSYPYDQSVEVPSIFSDGGPVTSDLGFRSLGHR